MSLTIAADGWRCAVFSAPALKCGARDRWIGWDYAASGLTVCTW